MSMTVLQWLQAHPGHTLVVNEATTLNELLEQINAHAEVQDIYVVDRKERVVGHISKLRIANIVFTRYRRRHNRRQFMEWVSTGCAGELMERDFPTARLNEELDSVIHRMLEHQLQDLAVLDEHGGLAGTISMTELLRSFT